MNNLFGTSAIANQICRTITTGTWDLLSTDKYLNYDVTDGFVIIMLPQISSFVGSLGTVGNTLNLSVFLSGLASVLSPNSATIVCVAGDNINGETSVDLTATGNTNFNLQATPSGWLLTAASSISSGVNVLSFRKEISSAQVLQLFSTPILLVEAPAAGYEIEIITSSCRVLFNSIPYTTFLAGRVFVDTASSQQQLIPFAFAATTNRELCGSNNATFTGISTQMKESKALYFSSQSGNPQAGNSDIIVYGSYWLKAFS